MALTFGDILKDYIERMQGFYELRDQNLGPKEIEEREKIEKTVVENFLSTIQELKVPYDVNSSRKNIGLLKQEYENLLKTTKEPQKRSRLVKSLEIIELIEAKKFPTITIEGEEQKKYKPLLK